VDVKTGKEVDSVEIDGPTGATPAMMDGKIYFGTEEGSFFCLFSNPLEVKWQVRDSRSNQGVRAAAAVWY
jgi:outer membrane protein assembly factor BamB